MSVVLKSPMFSPVFGTYLRRKAPAVDQSKINQVETYVFDLMNSDDQLSAELRHMLNNTKLFRYALYSNSFINSNLSLFEIKDEDDLSDIAYAYMKTHTYISSTVYIMLKNEMNKRGMKYLTFSSISGYAYTAMHKWAYDFKRFAIKADGEAGLKTIETVSNFISLFYLDDRDVHETTIYAYLTDMKLWRFIQQYVKVLHYDQTTETCKKYILDACSRFVNNITEIFIEPLEGYEDDFSQRIFDGSLNTILKDHNIRCDIVDGSIHNCSILIRVRPTGQ